MKPHLHKANAERTIWNIGAFAENNLPKDLDAVFGARDRDTTSSFSRGKMGTAKRVTAWKAGAGFAVRATTVFWFKFILIFFRVKIFLRNLRRLLYRISRALVPIIDKPSSNGVILEAH